MSSDNSIHTIAFYNTENLFDVFTDDKTIDRDFLPLSPKNWTIKRYQDKINKLGLVISQIGSKSINRPPALIGLAEVENDSVLNDLIGSKYLKNYNYGFIHYDSLDERGIDVALLFNKDNFKVEYSKTFPVYVENEFGTRDFTRDILLVSGHLNGGKIHVLVNHWPSRHDGIDTTESKRISASTQLTEIISLLTNEEEHAQIIVMGDFNDNPTSQSIMNLKRVNGLVNTMESVWSYSRGSVNHNFAWIQFDQILLTHNFFMGDNDNFKLLKADIFDENFLKQHIGKYRGQPYRTYVGNKYKGGFSDHFPVFIQIKNLNK